MSDFATSLISNSGCWIELEHTLKQTTELYPIPIDVSFKTKLDDIKITAKMILMS